MELTKSIICEKRKNTFAQQAPAKRIKITDLACAMNSIRKRAPAPKRQRPVRVINNNNTVQQIVALSDPNEFGVRLVKGFRLLDIQTEVIRWTVERELRIVTNPYFDPSFVGYIWAMGMGMGKSVSSGVVVMRTLGLQRAQQRPTLILTEKTLLGSFEFELRKFFGTQVRILVLHRDFLGSNYDKFGYEKIIEYDVIVTTYCSIETRFKSENVYANQFCEFNWFRIVLDESHAIRNRKTQIFKAVNSLKSSIRMCMTGTPIHNDIKDLFNQLEFCGLRIPKGIKKTPSVLKDFGILDMIKFVELSQSTIVLPPKIVQTVFFELSPTERFLHNHFLNYAKLALQRTKEELSDKIKYFGDSKSGLIRIMQVCTAPYLITKASKQDACQEDMLQQEEADSFPDNPQLDAWIRVRESASGLMSSKMRAFVGLVAHTQARKTIIFANLTSSLRLAMDSLIMACPPFRERIVFVHGKIRNVSVREQLFNKFRTDPNCTHLFLTLKIGGCGLNLVEASVIIFLEHWWNQAFHDQAESRAHRIGQVNPVNVYYLVAKNSIEERVQSMAQQKLGILKECNALSEAHNKRFGATEMEILLA